MKAIENWVKDIVFYMIFVTMVMNLLPDPKYEKYLRLFAGAVMILLAFGPLARITGMETAIAGMFEKIIFEDDVRTLKEELGAVDERRIAGFYERYRAAVESDIRTMAESDGLECVSVSARVADAGNLSHVKLVVRGEQNQAGAEIASVRRKIGAYYGVKNGTLRSMLKGNKEKVIFLFCSGLLLFVISLPNGKTTDSGLRAGTVEVIADVSGDDESTALEDAGEKAAAKEESGSYEEKLEQRIRELLKSVDGVGEADVMVVLKSSEERIWHVDKSSTSSVTEESGSSSGSSRVIREENQSESTVLDGKSQSPVMEKEVKPEISGVVISADGGGSAVIRAEVSEAMEALLGLPANKIKVMKRAVK